MRFKREGILSLPSPEKGGLIRERGRIWEGGGLIEDLSGS